MSLAHAILGFLQQQEMTGYALKTQCFDECIAHVWSADQAQIYKTLDKLEQRGWITCNVEMRSRRPNRKVYSVTEAGSAELIRWLQCFQPLPTVRDPLLIQMLFANQLPNAAIMSVLEKQLAAHREKLAACVKLPSFDDVGASRDAVIQRLVLELVMRKEQTYIDWLKTAIDAISCHEAYK